MDWKTAFSLFSIPFLSLVTDAVEKSTNLLYKGNFACQWIWQSSFEQIQARKWREGEKIGSLFLIPFMSLMTDVVENSTILSRKGNFAYFYSST